MIRPRLVAGCVLATAVLAGCSNGGSTSTGSTSAAREAASAPRGGTLSMAVSASFSLDPALANPPWVIAAAYDPLIHETTSGTYEPDLATSWGFVGSGNTVFQLTLRQGVKFSDGSAMTAQDVAASMERVVRTPGPSQAAGPVTSVRAYGTDAVRIYYSKAVPLVFAIGSVTQEHNLGLIAAPGAKSLTSGTDGVGPYQLSHSSGSTYTFVPNASYFDQKAIKYDKVVVEVMQDSSAMLNAVRSGQLDYGFSVGTSSAAASWAGLTVSEHGGLFPSLLLENRTSGPLRDLRVRRAIEMAIDRSSMIKSLYAGIGTAQSTLGAKGQEGYDAADASPYPYDTTKARDLLSQAGYPHGFTISALDFGAQDPGSVLAQAFALQLAKIGITLKIDPVTTSYTQFLGDILSKKYDAVVTSLPVNDIYSVYRLYLAPGTVGDGYGLTDPTLDRLLTAAATASSADEQTAMRAVTQRIDGLAWAVSAGEIPTVDIAQPTVSNVPASSVNSDPYPFSPVASQVWFTK